MNQNLKFIVCIVNRGMGDSVVHICAGENITFRIMLRGKGTADSETLHLLGIGDKDKDIVFLSVAQSRAEDVMNNISKGLELDKPGRGIAFSIPFSAIASQFSSYELLAGQMELSNQGNGKGIKKIASAVKRGFKGGRNKSKGKGANV